MQSKTYPQKKKKKKKSTPSKILYAYNISKMNTNRYFKVWRIKFFQHDELTKCFGLQTILNHTLYLYYCNFP